MIPALRGWHERYEKTGLTIVGVHSPEFRWEKSRDGVVAAMQTFGIRYPVVQDNDFAIWKRYGVYAWPTTVLVTVQAQTDATGKRDGADFPCNDAWHAVVM